MKKAKTKKLFIYIILIFLAIVAALGIYKYFNNYSTNKIPNSETDDNTNSSYYSKLYGTWTVTKHIPSKIKTTLSDSIISLCIGQKFTIEKDKITSFFATVSDPSINEGIMTASDFSKKYNDTFKNLGMPGNEIKYVNIADKNNNTHSVTIFIANDEKVYALLAGSLFQLEKT